MVILELIHADRVPTSVAAARRSRRSEGALLLDQNRPSATFA